MLATTLTLDNNPFLGALRAVDGVVSGFNRRINNLVSGFTGLQSAAQTVSQVFNGLKSTLDLGGHLSDVSAQTGATAGDVLILEQAFKDAGQGSDAAANFIRKMQVAVSGVGSESKKQQDALRELGLSQESLADMSVVEQTKALQRGFEGVASAADRTKLAVDLFGRTGSQNLTLLMDPNALGKAQQRVGGLAPLMTRLAETFDRLSDAVGAAGLKLQQLMAGAMAVLAPQAVSLAEAFDAIDLTGLGVAIGRVVQAFLGIGTALRELLPILVAYGAGWAASAVATSLASGVMVRSIAAVATATAVGARSIMASLGPVGLLIAGLTYAWMKFGGGFGKVELPKMEEIELPKMEEMLPKTPIAAEGGPSASMSVGSLAQRGLNAFSGGGAGFDPIGSRIDRTNELLREVRDRIGPPLRGLTVIPHREEVPV